MNRIATEVPQKVGVLFEDQDGDPGAREQQSEHHPGRAAAGDTAADGNLADAHASHLRITAPLSPRSSR
jgi:hypothetical protein